MKFEGSGWNRTPVIERNWSSLFRPLWLWPLIYWPPKSISFFYLIRAITLWSLKALGQRVLELLSGNGFHSSGPCDLDLWPTDPKINRVLLLTKGYHPMKFEGSGSKGTTARVRTTIVNGRTDGRTTDEAPSQKLTLSLCDRWAKNGA